MEQELKFTFAATEGYDALARDPVFAAMVIPGSEEIIPMLAVYYDTPDGRLSAQGAVFRVRREGGAFVATVKLGGDVQGGLHRRMEWNVTQPDAAPDPAVFSRSEVFSSDPPEPLKALLLGLGSLPLQEVCRTEYTRRSSLLDFGGARIEMCLDNGFLRAQERKAPLCEVEFELREGDESALSRLAETLSGRFDLRPEPLSKYARCLRLMNPQ